MLYNGKNLRMILPEEDFGTQIQHMVFGNPSFFTDYKQLATDNHPFFRGIYLTSIEGMQGISCHNDSKIYMQLQLNVLTSIQNRTRFILAPKRRNTK